jgi:4'-phosphopantetheinyl transferase
MIDVFFTSFENPLEQGLFATYLSLLPPDVQERNSRYIRWQNRHSHLLGKLLLIEALKKHGIDTDFWDYVEHNSYERPYLTLQGYDFNISHSGNYVMCAVGRNIRLGVDIEENRNIDFKNFLGIMTPEQWDEIRRADYPIKEFYRYWTIKESVIKADGRGFSIPLDKLILNHNHTVLVDEKLWFVQELPVHNQYNAALATDQLSEFKMHKMDFYHSHQLSKILQSF